MGTDPRLILVVRKAYVRGLWAHDEGSHETYTFGLKIDKRVAGEAPRAR